MMWPLITIMFFSSNLSMMKVLSEEMIMTTEMFNLMIMTLIVMLLNYIMLNQESMMKEKKYKMIINMVGMMVFIMMLTESMMIFLILMEATILPLTFMIMYTSKDKDKMESLKFMIMMNTFGSMPFMLFMTFSKELLEGMMMSSYFNTELGMIMFMMLFLIKTPMFLTHLWLTKVHVSASGNCSMILASIMIKMGTVGIFML